MSPGPGARLRPCAAAGARAVAVAATLVCSLSHPVAGRQARLWTPDLRTLVTAGGRIGAVAVSRTEVLAAAGGAILVFDFVRGEWRPPLELPGPVLPVITALGVDGVSGEVWVGTERGDVLRGIPGFGSWESVAIAAPGAIEHIASYPAGAATYILSRGQWWRVESPSGFGSAVPGAEVPAAVRAEAAGPDDPYLAAARSTLGIDAELRRWPITDIARGVEPDEFWLATDGGGLVHFQSRGGTRERYRFGLVAPGAATVAQAGGRLWFGGDGRGRQNGVAAATRDLSRWWQYESVSGAPSGFVAEITSDGQRVWFAAEDGLYRFDPDPVGSGREWTRFNSSDGLPSNRVRSVLYHDGRIWIGTDRGVVALDTTGRRVTGTLMVGGRVGRVAVRDETLWLAGEDGLRTVELTGPGADGTPRPPAGVPSFVANARAIDVVTGAGTWAITDVGLFRVDAAAGQGPVGDAMLRRIGPPVRLAAGPGRLWVAGPAGVAHLDLETGIWEAFTVPADIPAGPVLDVVPMGDDVWIATPAGALRLRWR